MANESFRRPGLPGARRSVGRVTSDEFGILLKIGYLTRSALGGGNLPHSRTHPAIGGGNLPHSRTPVRPVNSTRWADQGLATNCLKTRSGGRNLSACLALFDARHRFGALLLFYSQFGSS
ncbi:hypothetical protein COCOBI_pt-0060 (chloroplast) [Coccomyxa sp. Obi]|nr:hypothetical protein COCOBI_pt-0060 [Coccomyxa sp. Obi]